MWGHGWGPGDGLGGMMGYGGGWGDMGSMMLFGGVFWLLVLVLAVAAVIWAVRASTGDHRPSAPRRGSSALDLLEERYARGEIDRDEYVQKRGDLTGRRGT